MLGVNGVFYIIVTLDRCPEGACFTDTTIWDVSIRRGVCQVTNKFGIRLTNVIISYIVYYEVIEMTMRTELILYY